MQCASKRKIFLIFIDYKMLVKNMKNHLGIVLNVVHQLYATMDPELLLIHLAMLIHEYQLFPIFQFPLITVVV